MNFIQTDPHVAVVMYLVHLPDGTRQFVAFLPALRYPGPFLETTINTNTFRKMTFPAHAHDSKLF